MNYQNKQVSNKLHEVSKSILELINILIEVNEDDQDTEINETTISSEDGEEIRLSITDNDNKRTVKIRSKDLDISLKL